MRTVGSLLAGLVVAGTVAGQSTAPRIASYQIAVDLRPSSDTIQFHVELLLSRAGREADTLRLDLIDMVIDDVRWIDPITLMRADTVAAHPGQSIAVITAGAIGTPVSYRYDGRVLRVPLGHLEVPESGEFVVIRYHGKPRDGLIIGVNARGRRSVFADNWPERARFWIPTVDRPDAKAKVAFLVAVPQGWRAVANGITPRWQESNDDVWTWTETRPIPPYTMVFGAGEFTVSQHRPVINGRDTIPIQVWTYPEDSAFADSVPFRRATEIVEVMQRLIAPFPYEKLAHVQSSTKFGGMENSSAIFYAEKPYVERKMGEGVVRHETAHQWFGDAVTERDWPDIWLSEGFATYFDGVIGAALDGDSVLVNRMRSNAEAYFKSDVTDRPIVDSGYAADPIKLLNANSYPKGAWVLHMLRGTVGDSAFYRGLRAYYQTYRDSNATSEDFQHVMERASRTDLGWFFRQWLHQPGYPQLEVSWHYDAGAHRAVVGITQHQKAEWGVFRLPALTLEFRGPAGAMARRTVAITGRDSSLNVAVPFAPTEIRVDPDGKLLLQTTATARR